MQGRGGVRSEGDGLSVHVIGGMPGHHRAVARVATWRVGGIVVETILTKGQGSPPQRGCFVLPTPFDTHQLSDRSQSDPSHQNQVRPGIADINERQSWSSLLRCDKRKLMKNYYIATFQIVILTIFILAGVEQKISCLPKSPLVICGVNCCARDPVCRMSWPLMWLVQMSRGVCALFLVGFEYDHKKVARDQLTSAHPCFVEAFSSVIEAVKNKEGQTYMLSQLNDRFHDTLRADQSEEEKADASQRFWSDVDALELSVRNISDSRGISLSEAVYRSKLLLATNVHGAAVTPDLQFEDIITVQEWDAWLDTETGQVSFAGDPSSMWDASTSWKGTDEYEALWEQLSPDAQ